MGFAKNTMETGFKRKRKIPHFYGYDPSIQTLPGDPRLNPPPSWFGVNFHPSQPVNNSWRDWAGEDYPLFDISKNKAVPLSSDAAVVKDNHHLRKKKKELMVLVPKQLVNMVLHSPQPVHNSWSDWKQGETHRISLPNSKNGIKIHAITKTSHHFCCGEPCEASENATANAEQMDVERESKVRTVPMPDLSRIPSLAHVSTSMTHSRNTSRSSIATAPPSQTNSRKLGTPNGANGTAGTGSGVQKSGAFVYKDRAQKRAAADKRNKYVQLVLRIKKQLYVSALEERVAHLEEQKRRILKRSDMDSSKGPLVREIEWALDGNATFDVATHLSCAHEKTDPWQIIQSKLDGRKQGSQPMDDSAESPEVWEKHFVDTLSQVDSIRLQLLLDRTKEDKVNALKLDIKGILLAIKELIVACNIQKAVMQMLLASRNGSQNSRIPPDLQASLLETLGVKEPQVENIAVLYAKGKAELEKTVLEMRILGRALSYIYRSYLRHRLRCDAERLNELLTSKQVKKVLYRVAKWRGELGDRMNEVLRNMGNLSIE